MDSEKDRTVSEESELLVAKLREHPVSAKLVDYALGRGIVFLVHPRSEEMGEKKRSAWGFFNFFPLGGKCFIFAPFDRKKKSVIADSISRQIFCLAHELGHFRLKDDLVHRRVAGGCRIWRERFIEKGEDFCLLKEISADIEAAKILKEICRTAMANHGWRVTLLNLWLQCSDCLKTISRGECFCVRTVAETLDALAKIAKLHKEEFIRQTAE